MRDLTLSMNNNMLTTACPSVEEVCSHRQSKSDGSFGSSAARNVLIPTLRCTIRKGGKDHGMMSSQDLGELKTDVVFERMCVT